MRRIEKHNRSADFDHSLRIAAQGILARMFFSFPAWIAWLPGVPASSPAN
ncbi:hypothetical protein AB0L41_33355 [Amycolatopsis mediterranei]